ncbi:cytochrome-c oxidase, cbb3-type subunit III [Candidatus Albibeggiatoa sp. nov. BB20]|uniref:cytochrome-c oxidase, cbb3-type subunit III n=1 Tax=Candidatus Albibeggiatoa sp. nov. BB20 TaxID=3162723 RepID=UPI003365319E
MYFVEGVFTSSFWDWFITIGTLLSILACFALILWLGGDRPNSDEDVQTMGHVWDEDLEEYNNPLPMWWLNMFYITLVFGLFYVFLYPSLGSFPGFLKESQIVEYEREMASAQARFAPTYARYGQMEVPELAKDPAATQIGQRLFSTYCIACHGSDAGGVQGYPNLRDSDWLWGGQPAQIIETITNGRNGLMPSAEANRLEGDADVKAVAQYVLSLSGREHDAAVAEQGKAVFGKVCQACHMPDGTGMTALGAPNLADETWLYGSNVADIEQTIKHGRQNRMPAHGEFLGDEKIKLLTAYIYSLSMDK